MPEHAQDNLPTNPSEQAWVFTATAEAEVTPAEAAQESE